MCHMKRCIAQCKWGRWVCWAWLRSNIPPHRNGSSLCLWSRPIRALWCHATLATLCDKNPVCPWLDPHTPLKHDNQQAVVSDEFQWKWGIASYSSLGNHLNISTWSAFIAFEGTAVMSFCATKCCCADWYSVYSTVANWILSVSMTVVTTLVEL